MMLFGTQRINEKGHLEIGGRDTVELAESFGTPLYVMDEALIRKKCREYIEALQVCYGGSETQPIYAGKAFLVAGICPVIQQEGFWLDVASSGEMHTALKGGFPPEKLVFHGNNKSLEELKYALSNGVGRIVIDNFLEIENINVLAEEMDATADVLVRATPGIDPHTHRLIRTGQSDTKFGFNIQDGSAMQAVKAVLSSKHLRFRGLHCHVGSQLLDSSAHRQAIKIMVKLIKLIKSETGCEIEDLNIGGGLGIRYLSSIKPPEVKDFIEEICTGLRLQLSRAKLKPPRLMIEPGRSIVGEAGTTLYTIGPVKTVPIKEPPGKRIYASVDGGLSDNPRPQMYGSKYECLLANRAEEPTSEKVTIAGKHCETDILLQDAPLPMPKPGDILAVQCTGAYNHSMASNYNRLPRPAVVLVNDGNADIIYRRESLDDLVKNDVVPERLS